MLIPPLATRIDPLRACTRTAGFSMVEMLVSLVVLAVGLLGVASLFAISLHSGSDAIARTEAISLVTDMADKIRANRRAGSTYQSAGVNKGCTGGSDARSCSPADLAQDDHYNWDQAIQQAFPAGGASGKITFDNTDTTVPPKYTIQITWTEKTGSVSYSTTIQVPNT